MYGDEYKHSKSGKEAKEKKDNSDIYKDKSQKVNRFVPSLEKIKEDKKRKFIPSLSPEPKQKRTNFTPTNEVSKETKQKCFTPTLNIDTNKKQRNFTPSLEMSEKKERKFFPTLNLTNDKKLHEKQENIYKKEMINKILNHISELSPQFLEYIKYAKKRGKENIPNFYPNRGIRITDKFKDWIKTNEIDPFKAKQYLSQIEQINNNKYVQEIVKHEITTTNNSQKEIARSLKVYGLNISPHTIKEIALKQVYNNNQKEMNKRFPTGTGGFLNQEYSLNKNGIAFENIELLQDKFIQYHEYAEKNNLKTKYANRGAKITNLFINWIRENEKNLEVRNNLIDAAKTITKNGEIPQYVMGKTIDSELSMRAISEELKKKGIYLSHHAIGDYARDHVLDNEKAKIERFPSPNDIISKEIYEKIKEEVKKFYPIPQRWISEKLSISRGAIERIAKIENIKEEYERKWPAREKISEETHGSVINDIKNTNLNMVQIADKHNISPHSVKRFAKEDLFKDDDKSLENRFPYDVDRFVGVLTHCCILDELTCFFDKYHKETFYAEPRIYRSSSKGSDGLILNDQKFLQGRLKDPDNTIDLSLLIHDIPAQSLNTQFDHIKAIQFDLTNNITNENIIKKSIKYQRPDLMLYIVGTQWYPYDL